MTDLERCDLGAPQPDLHYLGWAPELMLPS
jgi:hypothetical protein